MNNHNDLFQERYENYKEGDNSFLKLVFDQYYQLLLLVAYKYFNDCEDAKDVVSNVLQKLLTLSVAQRKQYLPEQPDRFIFYLKAMIIHKCLDQIKTNNIHNRIIHDNEIFKENNLWNEAEEFIENGTMNHLKKCLTLAELKIIEFHLNGYKNEEISKELNLSYNTIRNTISTAKNKLRAMYKSLY
mgnify:CR=1 FL=1